jgi:hypothetical protein
MIVLASRLLLAAVFALAALGKLARRGETEATLDAFGVPAAARRPLALALPLAELAIAAALLPAASAPVAGVAALVLLLVFTAAVGRVLIRGEEVDCNCFGSLGPSRIGRWTLVRNLALLVPAAIVAAAGWSDPGASAVAWAGGLDTATAAFALGGSALAVAALAFAFSWQLLLQNGRLLARLDALEAGQRSGTDALSGIGAPMPAFELPDLSGRPVGLEELLAEDRGLLLVFIDPGCHACHQLLPEIGRRQRDPGAGPRLVVISRGDAAANAVEASEHGLELVLLENAFALPEKVGIGGMPGAVLLHPSGLIVSEPAVGATRVEELLAATAGAGAGDAPALDLIRVGAGR